MAAEAVDVLIVGGGPAGLAVSKLLADAGRSHLVLERGRVAENWRSHRWDSFCLSGPNWHVRLPGRAYDGDAPWGYMGRAEIVAWLADYAREFAVPVREGVAATGLAADPAGEDFRVATTAGDVRAAHVVIATGCGTHPRFPGCAADLPADVVQMHFSAYRNPATLPAGSAAGSRPPRSPRSCCGTGAGSTSPPVGTGGGRSATGASTSSRGCSCWGRRRRRRRRARPPPTS